MTINVPNLLTAAGLAAGAGSIAASQQGHLALAATLLVLALILDRFDGVAARWLGLTSDFGARLDSLADLVSFGVAPVVLSNAIVPNDTLVVITGIAWTVASGWRLARFSEDGMIDSRFGRAFCGVPAPGAAAWLLLSAALLPSEWIAWGLGLTLVAGAMLMVSRIPYPRNGPVLGATVVALSVTLVVFWGAGS
ncbi:MAG: CDP-alcohol phosphatidyltransferase family protein [Myxococcota bacterium]